MTRNIGSTVGRVVAFAIPVGVFLSLAACVIDDGPTGLLIKQDQWLDTTTGSTVCTVPATATQIRRVEGILDVSVLAPAHTSYLFYPLVENQLGSLYGVAGSGTSAPVEELNNITMKSLRVKLNAAASAGTGVAWASGCSGDFEVPVDTSLLAPGSTIAEIAEIIRPCNAASLTQYLQNQNLAEVTVNATIRAKGRLGSEDIESPPFEFRVTVCSGCLQTGYSDPTAAQFNFPNIAKCSDLTTNPYTGDPCNPAQDHSILCCATGVDAQGQATGIQCPAIPTGTATTP
jgi:hypothetical protein